MHVTNLSRSSIEQLMTLRHCIKAEFNELISLSDDHLITQLQSYQLKTALDETRNLVEQCVSALGNEVIAEPLEPKKTPKRIYRGQVIES